MKIGDRLVGDGHPPFIIAEACVNHQGDFEIAKRMVYFAHAMGADAIKFQMHILQDEMLPEVPMSDNFEHSLWDVIDSTNFSTEQHRQLMALCRQLGIQYLCTPFSRASVDVLHSLGVDAFKTGSGELTNTPFMRHIAALRKAGDRIDRHEPDGGDRRNRRHLQGSRNAADPNPLRVRLSMPL